jgi:sulfur carrier protein ThiS
MYKIYDADGKLLGFADEARYVKAKNGSYVSCDKEEATGIAFQGNYYEGGGAVETKEGVSIEELRAMLGLNEDTMADLLDMVADHEERIAALEEG